MSIAQRLLDSLLRCSREDRAPIHTDRVEARLRGLSEWVNGLPYTDHDSLESYVRVVGDPMIIDKDGKKVHYYGPALLVNLNGFGVITALEFVGVTKDRNYIGEVWRYDFRTSKYKYRDFRDDPGVTKICTGEVVEGPQFIAGDDTWPSEAYEHAVPPEDFLKKFTPAAKTFFINCDTATFMQGPDFGVLHAVLKSPVKIATVLVGENATEIPEWMQEAASMITQMSCSERSDECVHKVQTAQFAYALCAAMCGPGRQQIPIVVC